MNSANRIAVNTVIQYVQLFTNILISLITVRVLLRALGVEDYGVYNLIGGVVTLLSFISSSLSQTSVRFIAVSLGKDSSISRTREVFSACFTLHLYTSWPNSSCSNCLSLHCFFIVSQHYIYSISSRNYIT